jgi:rare lipoprotein A
MTHCRPAAAPALLAAVLLHGCATAPESDAPPPGSVDIAAIADAVPQALPKSRLGNPKSYRVFGQTYYTLDSSAGYEEQGISSWYGGKFHGRLTSSGEPYDMYAMTAAHRSLPLPTYVRVRNLSNGRSIVVKVNDRGPFHPNRIIDLSYVAALKLDMVRAGTALVQVTAIDPQHGAPAPPPAPAPDLYLQVGAFSQRGNAERLQARLGATLDEPVRIQRLEQPTAPLYRVQIGPLASVERLDRLAEQLQRLGLHERHVVLD